MMLAAPFLAGIFVLVGIPLVAAMGFSLTDFSGFAGWRWIGLSNFESMLGDDLFWKSLRNSAVYAAVSVPLKVGAAVSLALLLNRPRPGVTLARTSAYLPSVIPDAALALLWLWLLNPLMGPIAAAARGWGFPSLPLLTDPKLARVTVAVLAAFQVGEGFIVAFIARRTISDGLYEAAELEGATPTFVLRKITLRLMGPVILLLALRDTIMSLQASFVPALLITRGGPRQATTFLPNYAYEMGFKYFRLGYASALSAAMLVITAAAIGGQFLVARRWRLLQ